MQINIGILGLGTVGCGTLDVLRRNAAIITPRAGCEIVVKRIATKHPDKARPIAIDKSLVTNNVDEVLNDPDIKIVAELIGGVDPARDYVMRAIAAGKSVVTANKELIAKHGVEIIGAAEAAGVDFLFEGSVGGGIPLINPLRESLAANRVRELLGIVNGTTNYILTKMTRQGSGFEDVLVEAQQLGYAETDPTADVDGYDSMYKLAILASIAFNTPINIKDIHREGIRGVTARDIEYADELGYVIKLVALARQHDDGGLELRVHPALISNRHPLANVNDVFNAVFVRGDAVGDVMFYGRGAGADPTGSAVVGDIIEAARNISVGGRNRVHHEPTHAPHVKPFSESQTRFYVRTQVPDQPGMLAQIATAFGQQGVSLESIVQKKSHEGIAEIVWMTHDTTQANMDASLSAFNEIEAVREVSSLLRVEGN
ncbi:MAG TPA: homoserine dehydrogenase [Abditibacteriaceae bacterium]|jgi:homoserine dehydrogenase